MAIIQDEQIDEIVRNVWSSMLELDVVRKDNASERPEGEKSLTACVQITGDWQGTVALDCVDALARTAAAAMFEMEATECEEEDVRDAIGELTNTLAGNIKTMLPGSCALSLPSVTQGTDFKFTVPGAEVESSVSFRCNEEAMALTLHHQKES